MEIKDKIVEKLDNQAFGMANLRGKTTGLPMVIWVSEKENSRHAARIKVSLKHGDKIDPSNTVSITIENPRQIGSEKLNNLDFTLVVDFINRNKDTLLLYWEGSVDTASLLEKLNKV